MSKTALFVRHQARPGQRDEVRRVWEKHVQPRAAANPGHAAYYFCYDQKDADVICVFQLYVDQAAMEDFPKGAWYAEYLKEVGAFVATPPLITSADLIWAKPLSGTHLINGEQVRCPKDWATLRAESCWASGGVAPQSQSAGGYAPSSRLARHPAELSAPIPDL